MTRFSALMACLALIVTTLVPSGFMTAKAEDGTLTIRVCNAGLANSPRITSDHTFYQTYLLLQQSERDGGDSPPDEEPCDMGAAPVANTASMALALPLQSHHLPHGESATTLTGIFPSGLPPSTGPPTS